MGKHKRTAFNCFIIAAMAALFLIAALDLSPKNLLTSADMPRGVPRNYTLGCEAPAIGIESAAVYAPEYKLIGLAQAEEAAELFDVSNIQEGSDGSFTSRGKTPVFKIDSYGLIIEYEARTTGLEPEDEYEAEAILRDLLEKVDSGAEYGGITCEKRQGGYAITLNRILDGIRMDCFETTAVVSGGGVSSLIMHTPTLEQLADCPVMDALEAAWLLPETETKTEILSIDFSYVFADSIIQPAYKFSGQDENGEPFECYIPAAIFS